MEGQLLAGRWRLGDRIGRGAVADVFEGFDDATGERAAIKVLRHAEPDQRARFAREVTALESLEHPNVVRVLAHGELDDRPFLVLECVDGGSLAEAIARGPLTPARAAAVGAALADALEHAHERGVVHRDVKPSNVLLDGDGRPRLADFGVAQLDGSGTLTASGFTVGTAAYLAPEQVRGEPVGPPADVYALGLLVLEATTGERAYPGTGFTTAMARLERPPEVPTSVPAPLASRLRAMTAMDPAERPTTAAVARDFALIADGDGDGGTAVLPVVDDDATVVVAAPAAASSVPPRVVVPAPVLPSADPAAPAPIAAGRAFPWRRAAVAAACFVVGFLLVLAARADVQMDDPAVPVVPTETTVAPTTTVPPTTAAPTTAPPPPPVDDDRDDDEGRGNGRGSGRERDD